MNKVVRYGLTAVIIVCSAIILDIEFVKNNKPVGFNPILRLNQGDKTYCTGTVINDTTVVTAAHCILIEFFGMVIVRPDVEVRPNTNLDLGLHAKVTYVTTQLDTAMLTGDFHQFQVKPHISTINKLMDLQKPGKEFLSCGYPLGGDLQCTKTIYKMRDNFSLRVEGLLLPGMSGGPTMTTDGTIIGINNAVDGTDSIITPIYNVDFNMAVTPKDEE